MPDTFERLRDVLARAYDDPDKAQIVVVSAGIPASAQPINQPDMDTWWWRTLRLAWRRNLLVALLDAAIADPGIFALQGKLAALRAPVAELQSEPAPPDEPPGAPAVASVLFDEGHGQGDWNDSKPTASSGYQQAAEIAARLSGAGCDRNRGPLTAQALAGRRVVVLPIGPNHQTTLTGDEIAALDGFIGAGGGLLALSTYCGDVHHHANLNELLRKYGILCNPDTVMPRQVSDSEITRATHLDLGPADPLVVEAVADAAAADAPGPDLRRQLLAGVTAAPVQAPCSLAVDRRRAVSVLRSQDGSWVCEPDPFQVVRYLQHYHRQFEMAQCVLAAAPKDRVAVAGSWRMFEDRFMAGDNRRLFENLLAWLIGKV